MARGWVNLPEEYLASIGRVIACFNVLENLLTDDIHYIIAMLTVRDPPVFDLSVGRCITAEMSFKQKVALLSSLYRRVCSAKDEPPDLKEMLNLTLQAEEKRNTVAHSFWAGSVIPGTISRLKISAKRKAGLKVEFQQMTPEEVDKLADFVDDAAFRVAFFSANDPLILHAQKSLQVRKKQTPVA